MQQGIGDLTSTAVGTAARFNAGKPRVDLIPAGLFAAVHEALKERRNKGQAADWGEVLHALERFQLRGGSITSDRGSLVQAMVCLGAPADVWVECAKVFDYGRKKYSQRGDCTCSAGNAARKKLVDSSAKKESSGDLSGGCAEGATTWTSSLETLPIESVKQPTTESGWRTRGTGRGQESRSGSGALHGAKTLDIGQQGSTAESRPTTGLTETLTNALCLSAAVSADLLSVPMSTTATQPDRCEACSAIPATLALDFSKGLTAGLSEHSPTCGVHKTPGMTGSWNWAKGQAWSVPLASALRHIVFGILAGEAHDPESGETHRGHVACNIVMLLWFLDTYPEGDDRPTNLIRNEAPK